VLAHVTLTATDLDAALALFDAALAPLGLARAVDFPDEEDADEGVDVAGYGVGDDVHLWVVRGLEPTTNAHVAFAAADRVAVEEFHAAAVAAGATSRRAPRRWAIYRSGYFGAVVADSHGNLLEAISAE
jgi:catechol 2,3-dioxygenase-like lactoylglutathione lyase family enzyme